MDLVVFWPLMFCLKHLFQVVYFGEKCFKFASVLKALCRKEQPVRQNSLFIFVGFTYSSLQFYLTPKMLDQLLVRF